MPVTTKIREMTPDEAAWVEAERQRIFDLRMPNLTVWPGVLGGGIAAGITWFLSGQWWLAVLVFALVCAIGIFESVMSRRHYASVPTQYDRGEGTWKVRELIIESTALVTAMDDTEEYRIWALFKVDDDHISAEDMFYFVDLTEEHVDPAEFAYEHIELKQLWPFGPTLVVETSGEPIPYEQIDFNEFLWDVEHYEDEDDFILELSDVPQPIRDAFKS